MDWTVVGVALCANPTCMCGKTVFTCPDCDRVSHHPKDAQYGWCAACRRYTGETHRQRS
jgi:hypothetical protein